MLDGAKRWIGGACTADVLGDLRPGSRPTAQVKAFLVPRETPRRRLDKIGGKTSLRMMQNADIDLDGRAGARVGAAGRTSTPSPTSPACCGRMRSDVAWIATGVQAGAYEAAVRYTTDASQFGRPIGGFQLIQEKLARMLANLTASLGMVVRLTQQQDQGDLPGRGLRPGQDAAPA